MNKAAKSFLIPVRELLPSEITRIRREAIDKVVAMASVELRKPIKEMVVRDIRPQADLDWGSDATYIASELTLETWVPEVDSDAWTWGVWRSLITSGSQVMADSRWIAITGIKDSRLNNPTQLLMLMNFIKIIVGGNDRVIWDLQSMEAYPEAMAAISPSPVVIPQNTQFDIQLYHAIASDNNALQDKDLHLVIDGFVVEPRGKTISP